MLVRSDFLRPSAKRQVDLDITARSSARLLSRLRLRIGDGRGDGREDLGRNLFLDVSDSSPVNDVFTSPETRTMESLVEVIA